MNEGFYFVRYLWFYLERRPAKIEVLDGGILKISGFDYNDAVWDYEKKNDTKNKATTGTYILLAPSPSCRLDARRVQSRKRRQSPEYKKKERDMQKKRKILRKLRVSSRRRGSGQLRLVSSAPELG